MNCKELPNARSASHPCLHRERSHIQTASNRTDNNEQTLLFFLLDKNIPPKIKNKKCILL